MLGWHTAVDEREAMWEEALLPIANEAVLMRRCLASTNIAGIVALDVDIVQQKNDGDVAEAEPIAMDRSAEPIVMDPSAKADESGTPSTLLSHFNFQTAIENVWAVRTKMRGAHESDTIPTWSRTWTNILILDRASTFVIVPAL